jgi:glycogen synthase
VKHLIICGEYPPATGGGIGTYAYNISRLLAESGETVHVIGQLWDDTEKKIEEQCNGNLIIHRVPFEDRTGLLWRRAHSKMRSKVARALYASDYPIRSFSWLAGSLAERLVAEEGIDLIEAQDYEAPLYYFQLRRALGLGPKRHPPCVIHLHSPTEFIVRYNDWHMTQPRFLIAKRMEDYAISAADALLCPSRFLARQAEVHYGLPKQSVEVIPYPLGHITKIERDETTWSNGSICYVGRLERRKGALEWIEAAVGIARQNAHTSFEFVGANILGSNPILSEVLLDHLIPSHLKEQFIFHGNMNRSLIPQILKRARIAVVPSRWENFPNTCVEAMASGLPVIASPEGGMIEMLADGQTGWIAEGPSSAGLRNALVRALETPPTRLAEMGRNAVRSIREACDNRKIVERHLSFRRRLVGLGAKSQLLKPIRKSPSANQHHATKVSVLDVLADYGADGLEQAAGSCAREATKWESVGQFRQMVVADTQRTGPLPFWPHTVTGSGWFGGLTDSLATIRCLIVNPKITFRVLQQFVSQ